MTNFVVADSSGVILRTGTCPTSMLPLQAKEGEMVIAGKANDATQYVDTETITIVDKPSITAALSKTTLLADGVDSITITDLPQPCTAHLDTQRYEVPDGELEFTVDLPGVYQICIEALHHLPFNAEVTAT